MGLLEDMYNFNYSKYKEQTNNFNYSKNLEDSSGLEDNFKEILKELEETFLFKNSDYGNAVDITYLMFGNTAQLVRLWDKLLRITQLHLSGESLVKDESVEDTLKDLANYAIIALAQKRTYNSDNTELGTVFMEFIEKANKKARR